MKGRGEEGKNCETVANARGDLTCMPEAVTGGILLFGLSDDYPNSSISSCCLCVAFLTSRMSGGMLGFCGGCLPGDLPAPPHWLSSPFALSLGRVVLGTQGRFMGGRLYVVQMRRAATISCQQNLWRYTSEEEVVSN